VTSFYKLGSESKPVTTVAVSVLLALLVLAVFAQVRHFEFSGYDDGDYVLHNEQVQQGLNCQSVRWAFTTGHAANWHPLTWLSHMLDWKLYGKNPGGHHLTNVLLHIADTVLLLLLLKRMTGSLWPSAFVAALFGLHPLHVESVAWIAERKDVLSTSFGLLALLCYAAYAASPMRGQESADEHLRGTSRASVYYCLALVAFALGLMSKPMLVTLQKRAQSFNPLPNIAVRPFDSGLRMLAPTIIWARP